MRCRDTGAQAAGPLSPPSSGSRTVPREVAPKEVVQNKLHQILSSTSSQSEDDERDPLEEMPLENYQGVASFGRAVYEVWLERITPDLACNAEFLWNENMRGYKRNPGGGGVTGGWW